MYEYTFDTFRDNIALISDALNDHAKAYENIALED